MYAHKTLRTWVKPLYRRLQDREILGLLLIKPLAFFYIPGTWVTVVRPHLGASGLSGSSAQEFKTQAWGTLAWWAWTRCREPASCHSWSRRRCSTGNRTPRTCSPASSAATTPSDVCVLGRRASLLEWTRSRRHYFAKRSSLQHNDVDASKLHQYNC